jgi:hypothetical protein
VASALARRRLSAASTGWDEFGVALASRGARVHARSLRRDGFRRVGKAGRVYELYRARPHASRGSDEGLDGPACMRAHAMLPRGYGEWRNSSKLRLATRST